MEEVMSLPFVNTKDRNTLPQKAGIYFLIIKDKILYIGSTLYLRQRMLDHCLLLKYKPEIKIYYKLMAKKDIRWEELSAINKYKPKLNRI